MMPGLGDSHLHSRFSLDSTGAPAEMIETAISRGLAWVTFTEHKDLDPAHPVDRDYFDYGSFCREIGRLRKLFLGRIQILAGVEVDFQRDTADAFDRFTKDHKLDFIMASVHALDHIFLSPGYFNNRDPRQAYRDYLRETLALSKKDGYNILGHLDYVARHAPRDVPMIFEEHEGLIEEILNNIIENGKGIELNTSGFRHGIGRPYPSREILRLYRRLGGRIITLGSDAHTPGDVGDGFDKGVLLLRELGFESVHVFVRGRPVALSIIPQEENQACHKITT